MKISKETINVLKNFSKISPNIFIEQGAKNIKTVKSNYTVFANCNIDEDFPCSIGIYDLQEFLSVIQIQGDSEKVDFDFQDNKCIMNFDSGYSCEYWYASKDVLEYPLKMIKMPDTVAEFVLHSDVISTLRNAAQRLSKPSISFSTTDDPSRIVAKVFDPQNVSGNTLSKTIDVQEGHELSDDLVFKFIFNLQNLKYLMENEDYHVAFAVKGKSKISSFSTMDGSAYDLTYYLGLDSSSTLYGE